MNFREFEARLLQAASDARLALSRASSGVFAFVSTTLAAGTTYPVLALVAPLTTTDDSPHTIQTYAHPDNTVVDWTCTIVGRDTSNSGVWYRGDVNFRSEAHGGGAPTLSPGVPAAVNTDGGGAVAWGGPSVAIVGHNVVVSVTGAVATNVAWSVASQQQVRQ